MKAAESECYLRENVQACCYMTYSMWKSSLLQSVFFFFLNLVFRLPTFADHTDMLKKGRKTRVKRQNMTFSTKKMISFVVCMMVL